jgi:raffinose/stachyose/melibiose transport system substrate-binding protein
MKSKFKITPAYLSVAILVAGYLFSVVNFANVSRGVGSDSPSEGGERIIRVSHWQLEPGYREGLDWAIEQYNNLPHVREANVRVIQLAISERFYNQFMNVHLIAGTAPDIAGAGQTRLIQGNAIARFYTPLSAFTNDPNPYNQPQYLRPDLDPETAEFLTRAPWIETFVDLMEGGFNFDLNDYFSVPVSSWGGIRAFYNMSLLSKSKQHILAAFEQESRPQWLKDSLVGQGGPNAFEVIPESAELMQWLHSDEVPQTLGQLILALEGLKQVADQLGNDFLVGVSASSYYTTPLHHRYREIFFHEPGSRNAGFQPSGIGAFETVISLFHGGWSFHDPAVVAFYELARHATRFYPRGWLGLDREQAQRRFVLGNAMMIITGGWDASGIIRAVAERTEPFDIVVERLPPAAEGERYAEFVPMMQNEANTRLGVPLAINRQSRNFDHALDFLKFLSSHTINEEFNIRAGWAPAIVGSNYAVEMIPFRPFTEGLSTYTTLRLDQTAGRFRSEFSGSEPLFITGEITFDAFVDRMMAVFDNPRLGISNIWFREWQRVNDLSRSRDRSLAIERTRALLMNEEQSWNRTKPLMQQASTNDAGHNIRRFFRRLNPDQPFPLQ